MSAEISRLRTLFATPKHERDVEPERSLPNSAYSGRITRHPKTEANSPLRIAPGRSFYTG
jgi:hypothetical protein